MIEARHLIEGQRGARLSEEVAKGAASPCTFKGVMDGARKTLITPWSTWYRDVEVVAARGDRWFCSEADAISAGWREPLWLMSSVVSGVYNPKR